MTSNSREKTAARSIQNALDIPYVLALRLMRAALAEDPKLRGTYLNNRCRELLKKEQKS